MGRLSDPEVRALLDFLREMATARDLSSFRQRLPQAMTRLVPAEMATYFEVDRRRRRVMSHHYPGDAVGRPEEQAFLRSMHQLPSFQSYRRGDGSAVKISDFLTRSAFQRLTLYDEFFRRIGIDHQIAKGLPGPSGLVTGIALNRRARDFSESDRLLLNLLRPHLNETYRTAAMLTEMRDELNLLRHGLEKIDRGLLVVDATGRVRLMTARAQRWITEYFGRMPHGALPEALRRWIDYDEALLSGPATPVTPRAPLVAEREGWRLDVRMVFDGDQRLLLLDERRTAAPTVRELEGLGLSRRQAEVLVWITEGKTNGEIATILGLSERTVEKHVQHILERLGVETRTAAAARALAVK
jgi:DNA-binding CsgD family transcriptional regulator